MNIYDVFLILSIAAGLFMAFNLGANDVANSMASAVGANAITVRQAVVIAGVLNLVGAVFLGSHVMATISKGIINADLITDQKLLMVGMFASLLAAGLWVLISTATSLPVSSTHSIVGGILGFGFVAGGPEVVQWGKVLAIVASWIISPFFGAFIGYAVFSHIKKYILLKEKFIHQTRRWAPFWIMITSGIVVLSFFYKTPLGKSMGLSRPMKFLVMLAICAIFWFIGVAIVRLLMKGKDKSADTVEGVFQRMQIGTSCYVALSHGANDVANAIGPVAAIYWIARDHEFVANAQVPLFLILLGGLGIALGIALYGYKVIATVGGRITTLNNTRGFSVDFGAATTVLMASNLGLPVSSTHAAVGSIVGVGLARGFHAVDFRILAKIVLYWILTVPIAAFTSILLFQILRWFLL